ncbi:hypothetical protein HA075_19655 [bacterium BFN5]|nr:hypothetical protein HA075_19620 [bacterium BFN5]QJW47774.1 hypothetical protein HA075_19655 [bacterium BFN5]
MRKILLAAVCASLMATATAAAAPSTNGSTGLINTPSADVLREGQFSLGYYNEKDIISCCLCVVDGYCYCCRCTVD